MAQLRRATCTAHPRHLQLYVCCPQAELLGNLQTLMVIRDKGTSNQSGGVYITENDFCSMFGMTGLPEAEYRLMCRFDHHPTRQSRVKSCTLLFVAFGKTSEPCQEYRNNTRIWAGQTQLQ